MPAPATIDDFLDVVRKSNQIDTDRLVADLLLLRRAVDKDDVADQVRWAEAFGRRGHRVE